MQKLGVGLVGFGFIGKVHSLAYRALPLLYDPLPAQTELIGVCTAREASGRKAIEQAGFTFHTTDYHALLSRDDIQIINVCVPNDAHYSVVRDALKAGKHVYCDKPLALDVAVRDGRIREGQHLMLVGVGGGFTWGSVFVRW